MIQIKNFLQYCVLWSLLLSSACMSSISSAADSPSFIAFESAPVRPVARYQQKLLVTNIPDNVLEIFTIDGNGRLKPDASVYVGMEPVAVAVREGSNGPEAWVVNHLSDSISVVDLSSKPYRVKRTLLVGDEPRDIVFARDRAFITTAHRGQQRTDPSIANVPGAGDPQLYTASVPRADIWVFDGKDQGKAFGGKPEKIIELFGDTPRALSVSPDGNTVYAAIFNSGNQTTAITESALCNGFDDYGWDEGYIGTEPCQVMDKITSPHGLPDGMLPGGRAGPGKNKQGEYQPWTGIIVKYDRKSGEWRDVKGRNFSNAVRFTLPDLDVFAIDANSLKQVNSFAHAGTTLFNMAVNPVNGNIYVSNTDAQNHIRFEGSGEFGGSTVQGNIARARITVINPKTGEVKPRHLNRHIDYKVLKAPASVKQHTVAQPTEMRVSADGKTLYVTAIGSGKIAVYNTADLENDRLWAEPGKGFDPAKASARHIKVPNGPMGLLLDEKKQQLYVFSRYNNAVNVVGLEDGQVHQTVAMYNPEPQKVVAGRSMLYDADYGSSNGEASCASCHIFGDMDQLAWNLGNPDAPNTRNPQPFPKIRFSQIDCELGMFNSDNCDLTKIINGNGDLQTFASMKGPMTTQTMRGMTHQGHMHWRGDRSNGYFGIDDKQTLDEKMSFKNFIVAFEGLQGMDIHLPESVHSKNKSARVKQLEKDMDRFADFMLSVQLPPNPIRGLDNSLNPKAQAGQAFFHGRRFAAGLPLKKDRPYWFPELKPDVVGVNCNGCHEFNPAKGFYGGNGEVTHGGELQILKTPHFRNLYQKVGMFGMPDHYGYRPTQTSQHQGNQVRGFGFLHDGATDLLFNFLGGRVFDNGDVSCDDEGLPEDHGCDFNLPGVGIPNDGVRQGLVEYLLAFDSDLAPVVGQQITLNRQQHNPGTLSRLKLLEGRAAAPFISKLLGGNVKECELVARGVINGQSVGYLYDANRKTYQTDRENERAVSSEALQNLATSGSNTLTFTCVPPGSGIRIALDRDLNGILNRSQDG
ncbi:YncE family protein [Endozoicomonadaceae bacterium StTr2]